MQCPRCASEAIHRYGHLPNGKQRYRCQVCDRQFVGDRPRTPLRHRPVCPNCGEKMYRYMKSNGFMRYRCSRYPACRTYRKEREVG